jgi:branched-chain amino acid transport system substrate-binding protein
VPGMKILMDFHQEPHPNDTHNSPYMRGWLWVIVAVEALQRSADSLTGEGVKKALESLRDFDTWGLSQPFTYTAEDHRPTTKAKLYIIKAGKKLIPMRDVEVPRNMAWLGK